MLKKTREEVTKLVDKELEMANDTFPAFNSYHEGLAVIWEEVEEAVNENNFVLDVFNDLKGCVFSDETEELDKILGPLYRGSIALACEAIQVAAMAKKMLALHDVD